MIILIDGVKYILKNPNSEDDLEKVVEKNYKYIFGDNSFYFNFKRKVKSKSGIGSIPDGYLIILYNIPEWYILEVELASHPLYDHIIPQLTKFNRAIEEISTKKSLIDMFYDEIKTNLVLEANIKNKIGSGEIYKFISDLISVKPKIIIVINERTNELNEAIRDIQGDIKVLEFKIFRRECVSEEINAYLFNPVIDFKNREKSIIPKLEIVIPKDLNKKNVLPEGLKIYKEYKNIKLEAEIMENNKIKFNEEIYNSPSSAAIAAIQQSTGSSRLTENGWRFWRYKDKITGEEKYLDELRK
jgi:hypothetical protein